MLTYNSEHGRDLVRIVGTVNIVMDYEKQEGELSTLVVKGSGLSFLGGDWLFEICANESQVES